MDAQNGINGKEKKVTAKEREGYKDPQKRK